MKYLVLILLFNLGLLAENNNKFSLNSNSISLEEATTLAEDKSIDNISKIQKQFLNEIEKNSEILHLKSQLIQSLKSKGISVSSVSMSAYFSSFERDPISLASYKKNLIKSITEIMSIPKSQSNKKIEIFFESGVNFRLGNTVIVPMPVDEGFWYGVVSNKRNQHSIFKKYLAKRREKSLNKNFLNNSSFSKDDNLRISFLINEFCGKEKNLVTNKSNGLKFPKYFSDNIRSDYSSEHNAISLQVRASDYLILYDLSSKGNREVSYYKNKVDKNKMNSMVLVGSLKMDENCLLKEARTVNYDNGLKIDARRFDSSGEEYEKELFNPEVVQLNAKNCPNANSENFQNIIETSTKLNHVVIALLDTGIEYNEPEVSSRLAKEPKYFDELLNKAKRRTIEMQNRLLELQSVSWLEKLKMNSTTYKYQQRIGDLSNLISMNQEIIENVNNKRNNNKKFVGKDFNDNDELPYDYYEGGAFEPGLRKHGTSMFKILSKSHTDISILNIKYPQNGDNVEQRMKDALDYSINFGADIVNMSFGVSQSVAKPIKNIIINNPNVLFVNAAGNQNVADKNIENRNLELNPIYPAIYISENKLTVANLNSSSTGIANSSFYNNKIVEIGVHSEMATSGATAEVSRIAAEVKRICPKMKAIEIKNHLLNTADKVDSLKAYIKNGAVINETKALNSARKNCK